MRIKNLTNKSLSYILIISFLLTAIFGGIYLFKSNNNFEHQKIFAVDNTKIDNTTEIYREEGFVSVEMWDSLKKFYNNNKTDEMPNLKTDEDGMTYLTIDLFANFPISSLDLSNQNIDSIKNLSVFDLSSFTSINLSNNKIKTIDNELKQLTQIEILDISNNLLTDFSVKNLSAECCENLTTLNINNNEIVNCDLSTITNAEIFATNNKITLNSLVLPTNTDVVVWLSHNYIIDPSTENLNIHYGFQGAKNNVEYSVNSSVAYYGLEGIDNIKIYSLTKVEQTFEETEIKTLLVGEKYSFGIGYYKVKIGGDYGDISFYIIPNAPNIKMFKDGKEIELTHVVTSGVTIKLFGEDGAKFINSQGYEVGDTIEITKEGVYNFEFYQVVENYRSFKTTFYLEFKTPRAMAWVYVIIAFGGFAAVFYLVVKFLPQIAAFKLGKKNNNNKQNLD